MIAWKVALIACGCYLIGFATPFAIELGNLANALRNPRGGDPKI